MTAWQYAREDLARTLGLEEDIEYTIVYEKGPLNRRVRLNRMFLHRIDAYGIEFIQRTKGKERTHVFDGPEIVEAIRIEEAK